LPIPQLGFRGDPIKIKNRTVWAGGEEGGDFRDLTTKSKALGS